ncbi:MAG: hypothetical protein EXS08_15200 [Planctomycetes bacterium]|nr:hypothetical protein [Planctomycetota bacterium]
MKPALPLAAFALLALVLPRSLAVRPAPLAPDRPIPSLIPERCGVYLEASGLLPLLERGLEHPFLKGLAQSELGARLLTELPLSPAEGLARAEAWLGTPVLPLLADLTRAGVGLGFDPTTKKIVVVARGSDAQAVERALKRGFDALERQFGWPGAFDHPQRSWSGADVWTLGEAYVAHRETLLVLGNDGDLVEETLALCADAEGDGLLAREGFEALRARRPSDAALWAWVDLAALEPAADEGFRKLRQANRTPAAQGLLGAELSALLSAHALSATLQLYDERGLDLRFTAFEAPCVPSLAPLARASEVPAELAGGAASALLYRDYARFLAQRGELFAPEALPAFAEAITNGALFFEGQDLGEEVLSRVSPWIRLVSRALPFDTELKPEIPLPGLALVAVLGDERDGEAWSAAFQTIISIANVDRAQKGERGMRLHLEREGSTEISAARFAAPRPGEGVDVRYNLEPAIAVVGRHLVLGTHAALVREVVRELEGAAPLAASSSRETLELDARSWRQVLDQNFELLVARKMLEEGLERAAAEKEIEGLRLALASFRSVRVELEAQTSTSPELRVELRLAAEGAPR